MCAIYGIIHGRFPLEVFLSPHLDMAPPPNIILRKNCPTKSNADFVYLSFDKLK